MSLSGETIGDDELVVRYLLGLLEEDEAERLDELSVTNDDFAWRLRAVENDMVDAYVRGHLSGEKLNRFESFYLATPRRRERVEFAKALLTFTGKQAPPGARSWRWAVALGAVAASIVAGFLIYNQRQLQIQLSQLQVSHSDLQQRERELRSQLDRVSSPPTTLAVLLTPPLRGAARVPIVNLPPGAARVAVDLQLEAGDFPLYRVALKEAASSRILWRSGDIPSHTSGSHAIVTITLPAELFQSRRYLAELSSAGSHSEPIANYPFDVLQK
jgi:hypothetical protein